MWTSVQAPLFFGLIAAFVTSLGLIAVAQRGDWSEKHSDLFALAAAGMLVTLTILHIAPEALALSPYASTFILIGFFGGLLMNFIVRAFFPDRGGGTKAEAITPIAAIATHSFIDGVIYAVTFAASFTSGVYASLGLILHEFPEGVIAFAILRRHGFSNRASFGGAFAAAALTTPLGVIAASPALFHLGDAAIGSLFALSAGLLLYVATGPLMAPLRDAPAKRSLPALGAGVAIAVGLALAPIHSHGHENSHEHDARRTHSPFVDHSGHDH